MLKEQLKGKEIILASGSPRRQQFFKDLDIPVTIDVRPVEETFPENLQNEEITNFLAELKAESFKNELREHQILITSDTIVCHQGKALGKPANATEAEAMLKSLSGHSHEVITSVSFTSKNFQRTVHSNTKVIFKELTPGEIKYYIENFAPYDKAGGYAIQEWIGLIGITHLEGSYFNVVGLPTHLVYETLSKIFKC